MSITPPLRQTYLPVSPQQQSIIAHVLHERVTVVAAGAGSGKTHTSVAALLELVVQEKATPDQFVLITFTNKAADELRARIVRELRRCYAQAPAERKAWWHHHLERLGAAYIGTIHAFCRFLMRTYGFEAEASRDSDVTFARRLLNEAIYDSLEDYTSSQRPLLLTASQQLQVYELVNLLRGIFDEVRNRGLHPRLVLERTLAQAPDPGKPFREDVARLVADLGTRYEKRKQHEHQVDAHDLLERAADLLTGEHAQHVLARVGRRFRYLFVDEYQDTDATQTRIVAALKPNLQGVLVVGDRKQSIYGWRGAEPRLLERFAKRYNTPVLPMNVSRRPTKPLLDVQNALFCNSIGMEFPELNEPLEAAENAYEPSCGLPPLVHTFVQAPPRDVAARATATAEVLLALLGRQVQLKAGRDPESLTPGHVVVLCRTNRLVQAYVDALTAVGVPARADTGFSPYARPEVIATYRLLRALLHYPDDTTLALALDTPYFRTVDATEERRRLVQLDRRLNETSGFHPLLDWLQNKYPDLAQALLKLRRGVRTDTVPQLIARLYDEFGMTAYYAERGDREAVQNLEQLRATARTLTRNEEALSLRSFVLWLQQAIETEREQTEPEEDDWEKAPARHIRVLTIHRAKGLQYPVVVLPEVQEALRKEYRPPDFLLLDDEGLDLNLSEYGIHGTASPRYEAILRQYRTRIVEEEMRVLYVALTRAQHAVVTIGGMPKPPYASNHRYYSWFDELLRPQEQLTGLGARFIKLENVEDVISHCFRGSPGSATNH